MTKDWEPIAQCLRAELADYGGLLNLFQEQQQCARSRDSGVVLNFATRIEAQARLVAQSRTRRERAMAEFAGKTGNPEATSLRTMLSLVEPDARPLLKALFTEVNILLHRVRRASQQNHSVLSRAAEVHLETLQHLGPAGSARSTSTTRTSAAASRR